MRAGRVGTGVDGEFRSAPATPMIWESQLRLPVGARGLFEPERPRPGARPV